MTWRNADNENLREPAAHKTCQHEMKRKVANRIDNKSSLHHFDMLATAAYDLGVLMRNNSKVFTGENLLQSKRRNIISKY